MSGKDYKEKLLEDGVVLADLARGLGVSPQALNSKFNAKKLSLEFIEQVNKIVYLEDFKLIREKKQTNDLGNCFMIPLKAFGGFLEGYKNKVFLDSLEKSYFPNIKPALFLPYYFTIV